MERNPEDADIVLTGEDLLAYVSKLRRFAKLLGDSLGVDDELSFKESKSTHQATSPIKDTKNDNSTFQLSLGSPKSIQADNVGKSVSSITSPKRRSEESSTKSSNVSRRSSSRSYKRAPSLYAYTVAIAGLGRIGAQVAISLARSGVGCLILIDKDKVESRHVETSPFEWEHIGLPKTQAVRLAIHEVNPSIKLRSEALDINDAISEQILKDEVFAGGQSVDLIIGCLDEPFARNVINDLALAQNIPFLNAQLDVDGCRGMISMIKPGRTACLRCLAAKDMASTMQIRRAQLSSFKEAHNIDRLAKADIPGISMMFAGLIAQNASKILIRDGVVLPAFKFKLDADAYVLPQASPSSTTTEYVKKPASLLKGKDASETEASQEFKSFGAEPYAQCTNEDCLRLQKS